jgi:hypothetical protein
MADITPDDIRHALAQTLSFYDKELDDRTWRFWWAVLSKLERAPTMAAIRDYLAVGKFAPRPAHIVDLVNENRQRPSTFNRKENVDEYVRCPDHIAKAWRWYLALTTKDTSIEMFQEELAEATVEDQERYLHIVNHEAMAANQPTAIEDKYKLKSVWGSEGSI